MGCPIPEATLPKQVRKAVSAETPIPQRLMTARALAPLKAADLVLALFYLLYDPDEKIRTSAVASLNKLPDRILKVAVAADLPPLVLNYIARGVVGKPELLEPLVLNAAVGDETIAFLASTIEGPALEIIARNQLRILRHPPIADAVLFNPNTPQVVSAFLTDFASRSNLELEALGTIPQPEPEPTPEPEPELWPTAEEQSGSDWATSGSDEAEDDALRQRGMLDDDGGMLGDDDDDDDLQAGELEFDVQGSAVVASVGDAGIRQTSMLDDDTNGEAEGDLDAPDDGGGLELEFPSYMLDEGRDFNDDERQSVEQMLKALTASEKIKLATLGNREVRNVLLRDSNKLIAVAAASSPKLSEQEKVNIAASRTVTDDVIRYAANSREYVKLYQVKANLVMNPKTPPGIALRFLNHLRESDLRKISSSKNIASVVATTAKKRLINKKKR